MNPERRWFLTILDVVACGLLAAIVAGIVTVLVGP